MAEVARELHQPLRDLNDMPVSEVMAWHRQAMSILRDEAEAIRAARGRR
jgi:hypothetical protein